MNLVDVNSTEDPNRLQSLSTEDMPGQSALESKKSPSPKKRKLTDPVAGIYMLFRRIEPFLYFESKFFRKATMLYYLR